MSANIRYPKFANTETKAPFPPFPRSRPTDPKPSSLRRCAPRAPLSPARAMARAAPVSGSARGLGLTISTSSGAEGGGRRASAIEILHRFPLDPVGAAARARRGGGGAYPSAHPPLLVGPRNTAHVWRSCRVRFRVGLPPPPAASARARSLLAGALTRGRWGVVAGRRSRRLAAGLRAHSPPDDAHQLAARHDGVRPKFRGRGAARGARRRCVVAQGRPLSAADAPGRWPPHRAQVRPRRRRRRGQPQPRARVRAITRARRLRSGASATSLSASSSTAAQVSAARGRGLQRRECHP